MKQKDIALIIVIIVISAAVSLVVSNKIFVKPQNRQQSVEVVQSISSDFPKPDSRYFTNNSIDPTQLIQIGQNNNSNPFNSTTPNQ